MMTASKGVKGGKWYSLMDKVYAMPNLRAAFKRVKANGGAAGVDSPDGRDVRALPGGESGKAVAGAESRDVPAASGADGHGYPSWGAKRSARWGSRRFKTGWCKRRYCTCWSRSLNGIMPSKVTDSDRTGAVRML